MNKQTVEIPETLNTQRLNLKRYRLEDALLLSDMYRRNADHLGLSIVGMKAGMGFDLTSDEGTQGFVRQLNQDWSKRVRFIYGSWESASGNFVGELWIECKNWDAGIHEVGYFLDQQYLGKGFATEAANAGLDLIFNTLGAHKAELTCDDDNTPSYRVADRCGFVREGHLRQNTLRGDGARIGTLAYGMLREEYAQLRAA